LSCLSFFYLTIFNLYNAILTFSYCLFSLDSFLLLKFRCSYIFVGSSNSFSLSFYTYPAVDRGPYSSSYFLIHSSNLSSSFFISSGGILGGSELSEYSEPVLRCSKVYNFLNFSFYPRISGNPRNVSLYCMFLEITIPILSFWFLIPLS